MKRLILLAWVSALTLFSISGCDGRHQSTPAQQSAVPAAQSTANVTDEAKLKAVDAILGGVDGWSYSATKDEMVTNGVNHFATINSTNTVNFGFPYSGVQSAMLIVIPHTGSDGNQHYDVKIAIDRGQLLSGDQGNILVKLDDGAPEEFGAIPPDDGSTTILFFSDAPDMVPSVDKHGHKTWTATDPVDRFVEHLQSAKVLKVQVTAYQNGSPIFIFDVKGFSLEKLDATKPTS